MGGCEGEAQPSNGDFGPVGTESCTERYYGEGEEKPALFQPAWLCSVGSGSAEPMGMPWLSIRE